MTDLLPEAISFIEKNSAQTPIVIAVCGLSGAGKTTLVEALVDHFAPRALQISEDAFLTVPTEARKAFLAEALRDGDREKLLALAIPARPDDNPFADPRSWYDWEALITCLKALRQRRNCQRDNAWDQKTGLCNRRLVFSVPSVPSPLLLVDSNYPLAFRDQIDKIILLDCPPDLASTRQAARDSHRSDANYLAYKRKVDMLYCRPSVEAVRDVADLVLPVI